MEALVRLLAFLARIVAGETVEPDERDAALSDAREVFGEGSEALASAEADQLADLESGLSAWFDAERASDAPDLEVLRSIADENGYADAVRGELTARDEQAAQAQEELDRLAARMSTTDPEGGDGEGDGADDGAEGTDDGAEGGEPGADDADGGDGGEGDDAEAREPVGAGAVTAASTPPPARRQPLGAVRRHVPANRQQRREAARVPQARLVGPGGQPLADLAAAGEVLFEAARYQMGVAGGYSERVPVVRIEGHYPEERRLSRSDAELNAQRIDAVVNPSAIVAAGGFCAPSEPYYGVAQVANASRPVKAGLAGFQADRGRINWIAPPSLADVTDGVTVWTADNDADPGSDGPATKNVVTVDCGAEQSAVVRGIVTRIRFGNLGAMTYAERTRALTELLAAAAARTAEQALLDDLKTGSTAVSAGQALGAARDLLYAVGVAASGYRNRLRMDPDARLRIMLPAWVMDMVREDIARSLPSGGGTDQLAIAKDAIRGFFTARGVNVTEYVDSSTDGNQIFPAQGAGQSLLDFPDAVEFPIFHEGAWLGLDLGRIDLGVVRDSTLNDTNDYELFAEVFEGTGKVGLDSYWVTAEVCPNGASAGTVDPSALCSGQYVPSV